MSRRVPDLAKTKALLDWAPRYRLDDALSWIIADERRKLNS
jgi:hypothetical protein